jgi:signal transduction histidine kinase
VKGPSSLRSRVALMALTVIAGFVITLTIAFNLVLNAQLRKQADDILRVRAEAAASTVLVSTDGRVMIRETHDDDAIDVGTWIFEGAAAIERPAGATALQDRAGTLAGVGERFDQTPQPDVVRLYALPIRAGGRQVATVVTSLSLVPYRRTVTLALLGSSLFAAALLVVVYLVLRAVVWRALRPVESMAQQAAQWSAHDVDRRFGDAPRPMELHALATTLDGVLDRISAVLRHEKRLSAELSHELRTPLARILAEVSLLRSRPREQHELDMSHATIEESATQMNHILETLMSTARSESGVAPGRCDPIAVIRRTTTRAQGSRASGSGSQVRISVSRPPIDDSDLAVGVDDAVLERVLAPLVDNALRYARENISVRVTGSSRTVEINIADDGSGIPDAALPHLFEPGWRAEPHGEHDGAGLGLALAHRLAVAAGGSLTAATTTAGAVFTVTLPRA